jgi:transcriptional regulator with XRE-family HTH domain
MTLIPVVYYSVRDMLRGTLDPEDAADTIAYLDARLLVNKLVLLRITQGMTQAEVAERMGCQQAKVSKMERSEDANLGLGDVVAFAKALGKGVKLTIGEGEGLAIEVEGKIEATERKRVRK